MSTEWQGLLASSAMQVDGEYVTVKFANERSHRVRVQVTEKVLELSAIAAQAGVVRDVDELAVRVWRQNRTAQLVSFGIDGTGCVCATGWLPRAGLSPEEFQLVLRRVAAEADRVEYLLTGKDLE